MEHVMHILWYSWNYKRLHWVFPLPYTRGKSISSHTVQVKLRAKRGHFDYGSRATRFTQSSPHFGCKLNVSSGFESWAGSISEYQYAESVLQCQLCNPVGMFNKIKFKWSVFFFSFFFFPLSMYSLNSDTLICAHMEIPCRVITWILKVGKHKPVSSASVNP